jgi:hypothetical protein
VPPGQYGLRIGAREANGGLVGSVFVDLDAPDFTKEPLAISGILVTSASSAHVPTRSSQADGSQDFKDVLPAPLTAAREFTRDDQLGIFAEVYDNIRTNAHRVAITASVLADAGNVVFTRSDERRSEELQGAVGGYGYTTTIPLNGLSPGRYVLRVEAKATVGKEDSVKREIEFRVR